MTFQEQDLPENLRDDYKKLSATVANYAGNDSGQDITARILEKISTFSEEQDIRLTIKTYDTAYTTLGDTAPALFDELASSIPDDFDAMLKRQASGNFKTDDKKMERLPEEDFLARVHLLTQSIIDKKIFEEEYKQTGLPDTPKAKQVYQIFLEDLDTHFDGIKQQVDMQATTMPNMDTESAYNFIAVEKNKAIVDHIKAAKVLQESTESEKSIIPFAVFSLMNGSEDSDEELREILSEDEIYLVDSTIWGGYNILDNMQTYIAKDSMFQIAVVPLKDPEQSKEGDDTPKDDKADKKEMTKVIPLPQAMEHYRKKGDQQGIQAVLQSAVVPLVHSSGKQMVFPLQDVFKKIDEEPEYRQHVLSDIQTGLPLSFNDLLHEMTLPKILTPGRMVSTSKDAPAAGIDEETAQAYQQAIDPIETKIIENYVYALNHMEASEDMLACAEYAITNAIVTLENAMLVPATLAPLEKNSDYYCRVSEADASGMPPLDKLIQVSTVRPLVEKAIDTFQSLHSLFIAPSDDVKTKQLHPLFKNIDAGLQQQFATALEKADQHLGALLPTLENHIKKVLAKEQVEQPVAKPNKPKNAGNGM